MKRDVFLAIADPTRRAILALVAAQAMTPNALAEHFHSSRQAVSKHLQVLLECELIRPRHEGRQIYYGLAPEKLRELDQWLEPFRTLWEHRFGGLDAVLKNPKNKKR